MKPFGDLIYTPEKASGEAITKVESHTPKIEAPETAKADQPFEVKVVVGPHPNTVEHSIRRVEVYFDEKGRAFNPIILAAMNLTPVFSEPDVRLTMKIKNSGTIHAVEYCSLHGLWEGRKEVRVE